MKFKDIINYFYGIFFGSENDLLKVTKNSYRVKNGIIKEFGFGYYTFFSSRDGRLYQLKKINVKNKTVVISFGSKRKSKTLKLSDFKALKDGVVIDELSW